MDVTRMDCSNGAACVQISTAIKDNQSFYLKQEHFELALQSFYNFLLFDGVVVENNMLLMK